MYGRHVKPLPSENAVYNVTNPILKKIFNFNNFVPSINVYKILENPANLPCNCKGSQYVDKDHKHIATGDLHILCDNIT